MSEQDRRRIQELEDALRPFVDMTTFSGCEAAKLIDKRYGGLNPIQTTVTKFQFQAAHAALKSPAPP